MSRGKRKVRQKANVTRALAVNDQESAMTRMLDELTEFQEFQQLLPALRRALVDGKDAGEIYDDFSNMAAVRTVQIALLEQDSGKALSAIKDILDRTQGKAVERKEVKHKFSDLPDDDLDAILLSELDDVSYDDEGGE